ncbi:DNA-binding transcriptional activator TdcA [Klebsiella pneumoniae]|uniref:DNA-binding transcriptional activator TdcA n=1 Tax=Klebsiella pneumoniae TaxID=573 RepID=A0A378AXY1_KLEPN|nr:DNA-binding transcriptional activator TdcA [Klebsiella pneumoniae]
MKNMVNEMNALTNSAVVDVSFGFPSLVGVYLYVGDGASV